MCPTPVSVPSRDVIPRQGYGRLAELIREERQNPFFGLHKILRLTILYSRYPSPTLWVDQWFQSTSRRVVGLSRERFYQLPRDGFLLLVLLTPLHHSCLTEFLVVLLVLDILTINNLAGGTLIWGAYSIDPQRSFIWAVVNYFEVTVAFATLYLYLDCLNVSPLCVTQALYFSLVTATTVGFGDLHPVGSPGQALVICQLVVFVIFVSMFLTTLQSRVSKSESLNGAA
jgi:hypothetical protein